MTLTEKTTQPARSALVVEDDVLIAFLVQDFLMDLGVEKTHLAHDVQSALQLLGEMPVDIAVVNWRVGDGTGLAVIERLNELGRRVVISTGMDVSIVPSAIRQHNAVIAKPFDLAGFRSALELVSRDDSPDGEA